MFVLAFLLSWIFITQGTFLGKSRVTKCKDNGEGLDPVNGDGSFCHKKMVVAITVRSGQVRLYNKALKLLGLLCL
jgi:hypothetical protein